MSEEAWTEGEWAAFYELANRYIDAANALIGEEEIGQIGAAMLYACCRYNCFVMQIQSDDPSALTDEAMTFLADEIESHMLDHMEGSVTDDAPRVGDTLGGPMRVIQIIENLDGRLEEDVADFLSLADGFLTIANQQTSQARPGRVSAAFMHAMIKFNVYVMQILGLPPRKPDQALVRAFREVYVRLARYHAQETLVAQPQ